MATASFQLRRERGRRRRRRAKRECMAAELYDLRNARVAPLDWPPSTTCEPARAADEY